VTEFVSLATAKGTYSSLLGNEMDRSKFIPFDDLVGDKKFSRSAFTLPVDKITRYVERLSAGTKQSATGRGHVFFNGKPLVLDDVNIFISIFA
jgi:UDP-glucose:glycoprotein glucosyltransferase